MLIGRVWDMWRALGEDPQDRLRTFWSSYFVDQWAIWSVGDNMDIPCTLPSNQCIEAFFRNCSRVIGGRTRMRGSTQRVMQRDLPAIMNHQDLALPDKLCYEVNQIAPEIFRRARVIAFPPSTISQPYLLRGAMNGYMMVTYQSKFMLIASDHETGRFKCAYILCGGDHGHKQLSAEIIRKYEDCNYSYLPNNPPVLKASQANVGRLRAALKKTVSYMQASHEVEWGAPAAGTEGRSSAAGHAAEPLWATHRACSVCGYRSTNGPMQFECRACGLALCDRHSHGHGASCEAIVEGGEGYVVRPLRACAEQAIHKVTKPDNPTTSCVICPRGNPLGLVCTCKKGRKTGICPEVVAVNHKLRAIIIQSELTRMQKKKKKKARQVRGCVSPCKCTSLLWPHRALGRVGGGAGDCAKSHAAGVLGWRRERDRRRAGDL